MARIGPYGYAHSMALITRYEQIPAKSGRRQSTTTCQWFATYRDGGRVLQLDTGGSDDRKNPGKASQTLQLNQDSAAALITIIHDTFPGLK